jgi:hypothetical protein
MDLGYFPVIVGAIYIGAGIGYRMGVFPPTKRKLVGFGFNYNRIIVPDRWTMPGTGFDALENPHIWYPVSKRTSLLVMALGCIFALFWLAPRFLLEDRDDEDRIFLAFLIAGVVGQGLIWLYAYRMTRTYVRNLDLDRP